MEFSIVKFCDTYGYRDPTLVHTGSSRVWKVVDTKGALFAVRVTDAGRNPATLDDLVMITAALELSGSGCNVVQPARHDTVVVGECVVSIWHWVESNSSYLDTQAWLRLGSSLKALHGAHLSVELEPLAGLLTSRLQTRLGILTTQQADWIQESDLERLAAVTHELLPLIHTAASGTDTVHGDFHHGNVLWSKPDPVIADLEGLSLGAGAYDLAVLTERVRCYGLDPRALDELLAGYGRDLQAEPGFEVLVRTKQMISTQWCAVQALRWPDFKEEALKRLQWWRHGDGPDWLTNPGAK